MTGERKKVVVHHRREGVLSNDWGTPSEIIDLIRDLYGDINIDLASSEIHNKRIGAELSFTEAHPCLENLPDLLAQDPASYTVWCNPPGPGKEVKRFWNIWCRCMCSPNVSGGFLIYNIDHWRQLPQPTNFMYAVILNKRLKFVGAAHGASFASVLILHPTIHLHELDHVTEFGDVVKWGAKWL